jgi:hypothetical protein
MNNKILSVAIQSGFTAGLAVSVYSHNAVDGMIMAVCWMLGSAAAGSIIAAFSR